MYTRIHEPIAVCVQFDRHKTAPLNFKWGHNLYGNLQTNLIWRQRRGKAMLIYFGVNDGENYFKLMFNSETLEWWLEETG